MERSPAGSAAVVGASSAGPVTTVDRPLRALSSTGTATAARAKTMTAPARTRRRFRDRASRGRSGGVGCNSSRSSVRAAEASRSIGSSLIRQVLQSSGDGGPAAAQVGSDGLLADAQGGGDRPDIEVFDEGQGKDLGLPLRQLPDRFPQPLRGLRGRGSHRALSAQLGNESQLRHVAPAARDAPVGHDPPHPGRPDRRSARSVPSHDDKQGSRPERAPRPRRRARSACRPSARPRRTHAEDLERHRLRIESGLPRTGHHHTHSHASASRDRYTAADTPTAARSWSTARTRSAVDRAFPSARPALDGAAGRGLGACSGHHPRSGSRLPGRAVEVSVRKGRLRLPRDPRRHVARSTSRDARSRFLLRRRRTVQSRLTKRRHLGARCTGPRIGRGHRGVPGRAKGLDVRRAARTGR